MIITSGKWGPNTFWDFHVDEEMPSVNIIAGATIIFNQAGQVLRTYNTEREQWETPGGHIDPGEIAVQGARRELFEEGGVDVSDLKFFGFTSVLNKKDVINKETGDFYPRVGHSIYFCAITDQIPTDELTAHECSHAEFVDRGDDRINKSDAIIIQAAYDFLQAHKKKEQS